ncbi:hypothetical protein DXU77_11265 [Pseudomonas lactis]|nr:hypothetical protein [Pseudomonas lactis]
MTPRQARRSHPTAKNSGSAQNLVGAGLPAIAVVNPTPLSQASQLPQGIAFQGASQAYCAAA